MFQELVDKDLHSTPDWSSSLTGRSCLPASGRGGAGSGPLRLRLRGDPLGMPVRASGRHPRRWVARPVPGDRGSGVDPRPWTPRLNWGNEPVPRRTPSEGVPETLGPETGAVRDALARCLWSAVPLAFQGPSAPPRPASSHCRSRRTCSGSRHGQSCGAREGCGCPDQSPNSGTEGKKATTRHRSKISVILAVTSGARGQVFESSAALNGQQKQRPETPPFLQSF